MVCVRSEAAEQRVNQRLAARCQQLLPRGHGPAELAEHEVGRLCATILLGRRASKRPLSQAPPRAVSLGAALGARLRSRGPAAEPSQPRGLGSWLGSGLGSGLGSR